MNIELNTKMGPAKSYLLEITEYDRQRLIERLDRRTDKGLIENIKTLPAPGIVIEVDNEAAARGIKVISSHHSDDLPVWCVWGKSASKRIALDVRHEPDHVKEIALYIKGCRVVRENIDAARRAFDVVEKLLEDERGDLAKIFDEVDEGLEYASDLCSNSRAFLSDEIAGYCKRAKNKSLM